MAQRRMFSQRIVNSARFLKMPTSSQALYFHLGLHADDDGIVEAFNVLRMTGFTEDDLRILTTKKFVKVLNEDLVAFILDWREHNNIRADRKINSIYKDLLLQILPETELLEPKARSDVKDNSTRLDSGQSTDGIGKDRIGEVRIGKVNKLKEKFLKKSSMDNLEEKEITIDDIPF